MTYKPGKIDATDRLIAFRESFKCNYVYWRSKVAQIGEQSKAKSDRKFSQGGQILSIEEVPVLCSDLESKVQ
jgi:hypothetical protein